MPRGNASGYVLKRTDIPTVFGMQARGDREHDIAAWFGVNQGRVAEAKDGRWDGVAAAPSNSLPPRGAPGVKGRSLRAAIDAVITALENGDAVAAQGYLLRARERYDENET